MCANIAWQLGNLTCVQYTSYIFYLYWFAASRWRRSWNTRPLCYLDWFSAFKMAWVLEHLGHFATWIVSPPSRWCGSWNTWATLLPGLVLRPQDGADPGTPGPLCYLDWFSAIKMAWVLEHLGHFATCIGSPLSRWRGSWNTWATLLPGLVLCFQDGVGPGTPGPLCYLDWFSALKMVGVLEHRGHFGTWIGSSPSRWRGSWNTWATLLPGWAGRPQDGGGPGIRGPPGWPE